MSNGKNFTGQYQATGLSSADIGTYYVRVVQVNHQWELFSFGVQDKNGSPNFNDPLWSNVFWGATSSLELDSEFGIDFADVPLGSNRNDGQFNLRISNLTPPTLIAVERDGQPIPGGFRKLVKQ